VLIRTLRRRGRRQPCLLVGGGPVAHRIARALADQREYGLETTVWPADESLDGRAVCEAIETTGATRVIFAFGPAQDARMISGIREQRPKGVEFFLVPRLFDLGSASGDPLADEVNGVPLVWLRRRAARRSSLRSKRVFDFAAASLLGLVCLPVAAIIAVAIRLTSKGPILFRQERVGQDGRPFSLLKFRSMLVNDDSDHRWSVVNDRRITRVGSVLRNSSLDELPQLWNVIRGDMSLVGPRPERPFFVREYSEEIDTYLHRHRIPPGITGWAQIHGLRGDTSIADRVQFDNMYIENWSMWRDAFILLRTFSAVVRHAVESTARRPFSSSRGHHDRELVIDESVLDLPVYNSSNPVEITSR
jgi:exopolysaccharide biosynthesis polyprenyl glycosylphosphotransferase